RSFARAICRRLLLVAPAGLHKRSILVTRNVAWVTVRAGGGPVLLSPERRLSLRATFLLRRSVEPRRRSSGRFVQPVPTTSLRLAGLVRSPLAFRWFVVPAGVDRDRKLLKRTRQSAPQIGRTSGR